MFHPPQKTNVGEGLGRFFPSASGFDITISLTFGASIREGNSIFVILLFITFSLLFISLLSDGHVFAASVMSSTAVGQSLSEVLTRLVLFTLCEVRACGTS